MVSERFVLSSNPRPKFSAPKPLRFNEETKFYIDYGWWDESGLDLKTYLYSRLQISQDLDLESNAGQVDLVDVHTGEVRRVDRFQYVLQSYFQQLPDDFTTRTSLVDAVFCVLLANANQPMAVREIGEKVRRSPDVLLKTLGGTRVYQGIRPVLDDD